MSKDADKESIAENKEHDQKVEIKLYGHLQKFTTGAMGLYKSWAKYWFMHDDSTCQLLYYNSSNDDTPRGKIDIINATFKFVPENAKQGEFTISSGEDHLLSAGNKDSMMQWINQLQSKRNNYNSRTNLDFTSSTVYIAGICNDSSVLEHDPRPRTSGKVAMFKSLLKGPHKKENNSTFFSASDRSSGDTISVNSMDSTTTDCTKCKDAQWAAFKLQSRIDELTASNSNYEEIVKELSSKFTEKIQAAEKGINAEDNQDVLNLKDVIIGDLKRKLMTYCQEMDMLREDIEMLKKDLSEADNKLRCNEEVIRCKEQVVLNLSKPLPDALSSRTPNSSSYFYDAKQTVIDEDELEHLKDMNEAYQLQISHFQGELLQMQALRKSDDERANNMMFDYEDLKARHMKLSINHRIMMREFDKFMGGAMPQDSIELIGRIEKETRPYLCKDLMDDHKVEEEQFVPKQRVLELEEAINSYVAQNRLLEEEIVQINNLRHEEQKRSHQVRAELEKTNSHYMLLLREINKLRTGAETTISPDFQEIAAALIEQVKDEDLMDVQKLGNDITHKYDRYGFEITKLYIKKGSTTKNEMAWDKHIVHFGNHFDKGKELKALVRIGVPHKYRASFWKACIRRITAHCKGREEPGYYKTLLSQAGSDIFTKQIELDLMRTLPNNCLFNTTSATGVDKLRNVLLAFSRYNVEIGYCQGLNRIAAFALSVLNLKEEDSFWAVVAIVEILPEDYYSHTMIGAQVDQRVLSDIMSDKYPKIMAHFQQFKIDLSLITFNWFLTLYVDNTNIDVILSFWDSFFYEGDKVLFRYALSIFRIHHDMLLTTRDGIEVYNFCRAIGDSDLSTPENIKKIAFGELNPFPMERVNKRREFHYKKVVGELNQLNEMRAQYNTHKRSSAIDYDSD